MAKKAKPQNEIPKHIVIIPDGNRRWSHGKKLTLLHGYSEGIERLGDLLKWCNEFDIRMLSLWGFSTENFNRDQSEVDTLISLFNSKLREALTHDEYHKHKVRVRFYGRRDMFPLYIQHQISELEKSTKNYHNFFLNILLGYGGRQELVDAAKAIAKDYKNKNPDQIDERVFSSHLNTGDLPDPDLIIRTSGEQRLSGLLPWQSAYSELYFSKKLWPDFSKRDLKKAIDEFSRRKRRYGT